MSRVWTNVFIVTYLGLQVALSARGLVYDRVETRALFSWNMYSWRYHCRVSYTLHRPDGSIDRIDHRGFFSRTENAWKVFHRDVLPQFHAWLCEEYRQRDLLGEIRASARCALNQDPYVDLVEPGTDICTAKRYGVLRE